MMHDLQQELALARASLRSHWTASYVYHQLQRMPQEPTGAAGRWFVTPHAVRRYAERVLGWRGKAVPKEVYQRALGRIVTDSERAHKVRDLAGAEYWRGPTPGRLRYYVVQDGPGLPVLVTIKLASDGEGAPAVPQREDNARARRRAKRAAQRQC